MDGKGMGESKETRLEIIAVIHGEMMRAWTSCMQANLKEGIDLMKFKKFRR